MPAIHKLGALRFVVYPNDHRPAHVHVIGGGREAVFALNCPDGPPELREGHGFAANELNVIARALRDVLPRLCDAWRAIHGNF